MVNDILMFLIGVAIVFLVSLAVRYYKERKEKDKRVRNKQRP